ncbi:MAG TPA: YceH family protein [Burkholderiaceae bacterium]
MTEQESAGELLDPFEMRVLGVLAEKEMLTPDVYPLSLNALTTGCNQLSSRDPVMSISESTVQEALDRLQQRKLIAEVSQAGARVRKYEHRMRAKWSLEQDKLSVLILLMLRGAQTAGEIRSRSGRLHDFQSVAEVEACLQFLIDKYPPLVAKLARAPGTKEARYMHLFAGAEALELQELIGAEPAAAAGAGRIEQLEQEVARLRDAVADLAQQFAQFKKQFE